MGEGWIISGGERHTEIDQAGRVGARLEGVGAGDAHGVGAVLDGHKGAVALGVEVAVDGGHEVAVGFGGVAPTRRKGGEMFSVECHGLSYSL